jgi:iron only hydrogenase large subunit-like protein
MEKIKIKIDSRIIDCFKGETIMEVARRNDIYIPGICYCSDLEPETSCRLCLVEIKGRSGLHTSCDTLVEDNMEVITNNEEISKIRKINLELILSKHSKNCGSCRRVKDCKIIKAVKDCNLTSANTKNDNNKPVYQFGPAIIFDSNKCINCNNCIQVCKNQGVGYLEIKKEEGFSRICPSENLNKGCVYCGQCLTHCPSGAFREVDSLSIVEKLLQDKDNYVIFQFSSSLIKSIGKEISPIWDRESIESFSNFLIAEGARMVFDTSFGVDMVIEKEIDELMNRLDSNQCLFTSHCPSWVKYIKIHHPEFASNLSNIKSPHIVFGGAVKNHLINEKHIDPKKIFIISIAPCTSKKYEIELEETKIDGIKAVDYILTTNELYNFLKRKKFDLKNYSKNKDNIYIKESYSYDSNEEIIMSGLSALYQKLNHKELRGLEFKRIKDINTAIEACIDSEHGKIKLAIVYGLEGARKILKINPSAYQYIEVMACPGGCLKGGGQLIDTKEISFSNNIFSNFYGNKPSVINKIFIDEIMESAKNNNSIFETYKD